MNTRKFIVPSLALASLIPYFEGEKKTGWKLTEDGKSVELRDGNPVWIGDDGTESTLGGDTIARLNKEAQGHRIRAETAETKLEAYKDIDPTKAKDAFETLSKIDQKKLIDAGEVDRVKGEIAKSFEGQLAEKDGTIASLSKRADDLVLSQAFGSSKFIADKVAVPADMVRATFGNRFGVEDGKVIVYDTDGKTKLLSKVKQGEYADFDEGLSLVVNGYAAKDAILKGNNHSGSGNNGGGGGGKPGQARYSRDEFSKLAPAEQARISQDSLAGKAEIYDA